jgi:SulP family sulfate permease
LKQNGIRTKGTAAIRDRRPDRATLKKDALAGIPGAIGSVPDGMAASVLAGVSPVHGLYASFAGPISGGLTASSQLMVITTTSAAALAAGSALRDVPANDRPASLFLLTAIAGGLMIAAGIAKFGRFVRFVPHSVMIGFLTGVAVNIVCGQLGDLTGVDAEGSSSIARAWWVISHPSDIKAASLAVGLGAIALVVVFSRSRFRQIGALFALVLPSLVVVVFDTLKVVTVEDGGAFPRGLPLPALPELRYLTVNLLLGAVAVAALVLVQGAGVSESAPNPDGQPVNTNQDFLAQGVGNVGSALLSGQPVGGSVGQTALNLAAGATSRWASIFSGIWMVAILVVLSGVVGKVAIPTLAGVLIVAATGSLRPAEIRAILYTSSTSRVALVATFIATLLTPVAVAVGIGVVISLLLQLNKEAVDLRVVELRPLPDGRFEELAAPSRLPSRTVTVLDVYGSLLYAGSRTLQARLPDPVGVDTPIVVLRLRGRTTLGATFFVVVSAYAQQLAEQGGRLYLSGADKTLVTQMERNGKVALDNNVVVYEAQGILGASTLSAVTDANLWLIQHADSRPSGDS